MVSSVFLWRHAIQDVQANEPFQKLRKNLLLFIQLAVILLVVAALARPFARSVGLVGQNIVLVLDASASMKATDGGKSRFDQARQIALGTVDKMGRGDSMLVITASAKTRVASSFTTDKKALAANIAALQAGDTRSNLREAMVLALSLVSKKKNSRIIVISDGGFDPVTDIDPGKARIGFLRVGKRSDNVGITALDARRTLSGAQEVFIGLRIFSKSKRDFNMEVYLNDQLFDIREESLQPGETKQEILSGMPESGGRVTVKLDTKDDLASDNTGHVYLARPKKLSVLLVTKGNIFLEHAFNLDPRTEIVKAIDPPKDLTPYDIAIFDGIGPPDDLPGGGYLLINTDCKTAPAKLSNSVTMPSVADWAKKHPAAAYVDFSGVRMSKSKTLTIEDWGSELVECEDGAIAAAGESSGRRFVMLGWNLTESDFPLRVGFPIFVTNCIEWLGGVESEAEDAAVRTGSVVPIETGGKKVTVVDPAGKETSISGNGTVFFDGTESTGVYRIKIGEKSHEFACNLLSPEESNIEPRGEFVLGDRKVAGSTGGIRTNREFWRIILIAALGLISFEWFAFHRRVG